MFRLKIAQCSGRCIDPAEAVGQFQRVHFYVLVVVPLVTRSGKEKAKFMYYVGIWMLVVNATNINKELEWLWVCVCEEKGAVSESLRGQWI